jgi:hypothetical protein
VIMADEQVAYSQGGFSHTIRTDAGSALDIITIELLKPQSEPQNTCADILPGPVIYHCPATPADKKVGSFDLPLFKTDETDVSLQWYGQNSHKLESLMVWEPWLLFFAGRDDKRCKRQATGTTSVGSVLWSWRKHPPPSTIRLARRGVTFQYYG